VCNAVSLHTEIIRLLYVILCYAIYRHGRNYLTLQITLKFKCKSVCELLSFAIDLWKKIMDNTGM